VLLSSLQSALPCWLNFSCTRWFWCNACRHCQGSLAHIAQPGRRPLGLLSPLQEAYVITKTVGNNGRITFPTIESLAFAAHKIVVKDLAKETIAAALNASTSCGKKTKAQEGTSSQAVQGQVMQSDASGQQVHPPQHQKGAGEAQEPRSRREEGHPRFRLGTRFCSRCQPRQQGTQGEGVHNHLHHQGKQLRKQS